MRRRARGRSAWVLAVVACVAGVDATLLGPPAWAEGGPDPVRDGVLGAGGTIVHVDRVLRRAGGLEVTLTLANRGSSTMLGYSFHSYLRPDSSIGVAAMDPATGRLGQLRCSESSCQNGALPPWINQGEAVTVVVVLDDPGGATVDVVFDAFQPVVGVTVEGGGAPSAGSVTTLAARSLTPLPRTKEAAASVVGSDRIDLDTDVLFAFGKATLTAKAGQTIAAAARILKAQPWRSLAISGHTDGVGTPQANLALSRQRAEAVRVALAAVLGPGWSYDVQGLGETRPVASEKTDTGADYPAGRARNRRVELRLPG